MLNALSETAQNVLANLITIVLGLTVAGQMTADKFVRPDTLLILALGLVASSLIRQAVCCLQSC